MEIEIFNWVNEWLRYNRQSMEASGYKIVFHSPSINRGNNSTGLEIENDKTIFSLVFWENGAAKFIRLDKTSEETMINDLVIDNVYDLFQKLEKFIFFLT